MTFQVALQWKALKSHYRHCTCITPGRTGDNGGGGDHDGGASAGAQSDAAAGMGGY